MSLHEPPPPTSPDLHPDPPEVLRPHQHPNPPEEPRLLTRRNPAPDPDTPDSNTGTPRTPRTPRRTPTRRLRILGAICPLLLMLGLIAFFLTRHVIHNALVAALPQVDGSLTLSGLAAPVTVQRDAHGVPHIRAGSLDDMLFAQGFVTTQDRLWQMDLLRRHAAGELAAILGPNLLDHDRAQRTLQIRAAADRALPLLPPDQLHQLESYARGVNASIAQQLSHLPLEFRLLRYQPAPWTPRDSILVALAMFQDLTTHFPDKLGRELLSSRLPPDLIADLYPVGSWRDHPPARPVVDLTAPQPEIPGVPLDESQTQLTLPSRADPTTRQVDRVNALLALQTLLTPTPGLTPGSNNWAISGAHTSTGKPLLSNDMHLTHSVPEIWYQADLQATTPDAPQTPNAPPTPDAPLEPAGPFHVTGVSLPGVPFIIVGHNDHIAWGFTVFPADVQDLYVEPTRNDATEFQSADGTWHPILHRTEVIHVHNRPDVNLDIALTRHGTAPDEVETPIITPILKSQNAKSEQPSEHRAVSLRWSIYDPATLTSPFLAIDSANDWPSFTAALARFGGPSQNVVYADDQGHIGYHAAGRIPRRTALAAVPILPGDTTHEWLGSIPFDQLPSAFDPPGGLLATANARTAPDDYALPLTLDWADPYRNERIWHQLTNRQNLTTADMLALENDIYSDLDHVFAQRLAYAIDHATSNPPHRLRQAADILRTWNGQVDADAPAPAIVAAAREALWPMLLIPRLYPGSTYPSRRPLPPDSLWKLYIWGEKSYAQEQIVMHEPARWLPASFATWDDLLAAAVDLGLHDAAAPADLARWRFGPAHPIDIEHPIFSQFPLLARLIGTPTGTGARPQSGNGNTVKQVGRSFGPSERLTVDLANLDHSTLNLVLGQSGDPASPWFLDQFPVWLNAHTLPLPYSQPAIDRATTHTLTLLPSQ